MDSYTHLFTSLKSHEPSPNLSARILGTIERYSLAHARRTRIIAGVISSISSVLLVAAVVYAINDIVHSGIYQYVSLFASDSTTITLYWKEFLLSLVESFPVSSAILVLSALVTALWSGMIAWKRESVYQTSFIHA